MSGAATRPVVRRGRAEDAEELAALRWHSRDDRERAREAFESFRDRYVDWLVNALASGDWYVAVAVQDERLIGCMFLRRVDTVPVPGTPDRAWGYVTHAFVDLAYRNRGAGSELLRSLVQHAGAAGLMELHAWPSRDAISLYTRMGFRSPEEQRSADSPEEPSYVLPLRTTG